ncbi:MAG: LLM class flavin-dependent oxidoreductase [Gammaproteobacteria bacterium]|nr:LLM class flavin-dependent oxidoreductase [Gammaproteobacteria bacterium]
MRLGALLGPVPGDAPPTLLAEQARMLAGEGFESLWSAQAVGRGFMMTDPFVALGVAATVAEDVEVGTAVVQAPLYEPMDLAHRVFSLQQVSGDRLVLGVGAGSTASDFGAFGRPFETRFEDFTTCVEALREIFQTGAGAAGNLSPWPSVLGGPPLLFGTWGHGVERAAGEFDGWIASAHYRTEEQVVEAHRRYREAGGGRAVVSTIMLPAGTDLGELRERLGRFADAGFDDAVVFPLPGGPRPAAVRRLVDR